MIEGSGCGNRELYYGGIQDYSFLYQRDIDPAGEAVDPTGDVCHSVGDADDGNEYE